MSNNRMADCGMCPVGNDGVVFVNPVCPTHNVHVRAIEQLRTGRIPGPRRLSKIEVHYLDDGLTIESVDFYWTDTGNEPFQAHEYVGRVRYEMEWVQARVDGLNGAINSTS